MRKHFFESLEREIDFEREYRKLEEMVINELVYYDRYRRESINMWIERNFRNWKRRGSYISFAELREQIGFPIQIISEYELCVPLADTIGINEYFLYGEMLLNIFYDLQDYTYTDIREGISHVLQTLNSNIEKAGFEIRIIENERMIVGKNAVALEVADVVPELSDVIIEYNHFLLKGDMVRKKEILKKLADALEPKRQVLSGINKSTTNDFFFMVNNMNVRHNNCDPSDASKYCKQFDQLSSTEKEAWYDTIYEQGLALFVLLEQQERNKRIDAFKATL